MTKQSTATFVAYDLRPAKQAERRMLLDFLKCSSEAGVNVSACRYVGMGGIKFYDFYMAHRFLGISDMISLERDPDAQARAMFNRPFDFVKVKKKTVADFLASEKKSKLTIYWLDYDDSLGRPIVDDIIALGSKMAVGGCAFVTVCAEPAANLVKSNVGERLKFFEDAFGEFATGLTTTHMENSNYAQSVRDILESSLRHAFAHRLSDGEFEPLFQVMYRDTKQMLTVGGCFCPTGKTTNISHRMQAELPFLLGQKPYKVANLNVTEKERALFDFAVTSRRGRCSQIKKLESMGFEKKHFDSYRDLLRFLPRYSENLI